MCLVICACGVRKLGGASPATPQRGRGRPRHNVGRASPPVGLPKTAWKIGQTPVGVASNTPPAQQQSSILEGVRSLGAVLADASFVCRNKGIGPRLGVYRVGRLQGTAALQAIGVLAPALPQVSLKLADANGSSLDRLAICSCLNRIQGVNVLSSVDT